MRNLSLAWNAVLLACDVPFLAPSRVILKYVAHHRACAVHLGGLLFQITWMHLPPTKLVSLTNVSGPSKTSPLRNVCNFLDQGLRQGLYIQSTSIVLWLVGWDRRLMLGEWLLGPVLFCESSLHSFDMDDIGNIEFPCMYWASAMRYDRPTVWHCLAIQT